MLALALLAMALPQPSIVLDPAMWTLVWLFPTGMFRLFATERTAPLLAFLPYYIYFGLFIAFCVTRRRRVFIRICLVLGFLLILNVAGSHQSVREYNKNWGRGRPAF